MSKNKKCFFCNKILTLKELIIGFLRNGFDRTCRIPCHSCVKEFDQYSEPFWEYDNHKDKKPYITFKNVLKVWRKMEKNHPDGDFFKDNNLDSITFK